MPAAKSSAPCTTARTLSSTVLVLTAPSVPIGAATSVRTPKISCDRVVWPSKADVTVNDIR